MAKKILLGFIAFLLLFLVGYYFYTQYHYSDGNRPGTIVKFSKKGFVFKTYEGELIVSGGPNTSTILHDTRWLFSVKNDSIATEISKNIGKQVDLHYYEQMKALPWQGETRYFVDRVEPLK